jgi:hypothetical protein
MTLGIVGLATIVQAQPRAGAFTTLTTSDTGVTSICAGANGIPPSTCLGGLQAGPTVINQALTLPSFTPASTTMMATTTISHGRALFIPLPFLVRLLEHEKEHSDAQRSERVDQGRKQDRRRQKTPQDIHYAENQVPGQQSRYQNRSYKSEERGSLERHDQSMARPPAVRKLSRVVHWYGLYPLVQ